MTPLELALKVKNMEENVINYDLIGKISSYRVLRETNLGYILEDIDGNEYFLHHNECDGRHLHFNDEVDAFLYVDKQKRVAATLYKPLVTTKRSAFCEVAGKSDSGVYVNIGISKDILFSKDSYVEKYEPEVGSLLLGNLKYRAHNLYFRLLNKDEIIALNKGDKLEEGNKYIAYVYRISDSGVNFVTKDYNVIFVHKSNLRSRPKLGEALEVKIIKVNETDYTGTTIEQKEIERLTDADIILNYLKEHNGVMNYGDKTDAMVIDHVFKMSKSAFKRALGKLYKDDLVILEDKKTILKR